MSWKRWTKRQAGHFLFNSNWNRHTEICVCLLGRVLANSSLLELLWFWISYFIKILARKKTQKTKNPMQLCYLSIILVIFLSLACLLKCRDHPCQERIDQNLRKICSSGSITASTMKQPFCQGQAGCWSQLEIGAISLLRSRTGWCSSSK